MENTKITTIQVDEHTLLLLKKLKEELKVASYALAIRELLRRERGKQKSMAGSLGKYLTQKERDNVLKDLREKDDRL